MILFCSIYCFIIWQNILALQHHFWFCGTFEHVDDIVKHKNVKVEWASGEVG